MGTCSAEEVKKMASPSNMDSVNQICEKVEALEIASSSNLMTQDGRTLHNLSSPGEGDKESRINEGDTETRISELPSTSHQVSTEGTGLPSTSQHLASTAGNELPSSSQNLASNASTGLPSASQNLVSNAGTGLPSTSQHLANTAGTGLPSASQHVENTAGTELPSTSQHLASTAGTGLQSSSQHLSGTAGIGIASSAYIAPNGLPAPQVYFYGGNNPYVPESDGYQHSAFVNDIGYHLPVFQHEVSPLFYPSIDGGYPPQTFYSPGWTSIPAFNTDNIFYGHQFQHPGSIYQQVPYPESQYWPFPSDVPPAEAIMPVLEDSGIHGSYVNSIQFGNTNLFSSRPGFNSYLVPPNGSYVRGFMPTALNNSVPVDAAIHYDSMRPTMAQWMDPRNIGDPQSNGISPGIHSTIGQNFPTIGLPPPQQAVYLPHITANLQPPSGVPFVIPSPASQLRINDGLTSYQVEIGGNNSGSMVGNKQWVGNNDYFDNGQMIPGGSNDPMQRPTIRPANQRVISSGQADGQSVFSDRVNEVLRVFGDGESYNRLDFITKYDDAKFFVIKSYSEDDIHKSIKYSVWASTPNGNQKLNLAFEDAQLRAGDNPGGCPIFLFFSVNGSGRFCGVAEMVGPVDFSKSMDFWQQDKWTGSFSVRWHIIKDIPNSQLRHIILENNDNKPVTNSRDAQDINLQEGLEMLDIFKNYPARSSIVEGFNLYESRQRALQEKRARQKAQPQIRQVENLRMDNFSDLNIKTDSKSDPPQSSSMHPPE